MIRSVSLAYVLRSLLRHPRRTFLSIIGVGIGCGIALVGHSWATGAREMQIRAIAESGDGHVRVVPAEWPDRRDNALRLTNPDAVWKAVAAVPDVKAAVRRARVNGLLAFGNRTAGVPITGVEPEAERVANRIVGKAAITGRYLSEEDVDATVIGSRLARRLDVELNDALFVTASGRDGMHGAMLEIVGILETGSREIDSIFCHVPLAAVAALTGYKSPAEATILLDDYRKADAVRAMLLFTLPEGDTAITWRQINPSLAAGVESDSTFLGMLSMIIVLVSVLGIASAQLTAVLERRTEFAILSALGMKSRQLTGLIMVEAAMIGAGGALAALLLGGASAYLLATKGVNLEALMGEEVSVGGILLDPRVFGDFGPWLIAYAFAISLCSTLIASLYPAWLAVRSDPAGALRK